MTVQCCLANWGIVPQSIKSGQISTHIRGTMRAVLILLLLNVIEELAVKVFQAGLNELVEKLENWGVSLIKALPNILIAVLVFFAFYYISQFVYRGLKKVFSKTDFNTSLENILSSVGKYVVIGFGLVISLSILELDKTVFSMLAGVGVIGLALGFALKDLAANFISGVMLAIRAPIRIQDLIKIHDITGTVVDIRLRDTIVRTIDGPYAVIPNSIFTDNPMINYNAYGLRRIFIELNLSFNNDPQNVKNVLLDAVKNIDRGHTDRAPKVTASSMDGNGVTYGVELWIKYPEEDYTERMDALIIAVDKAVDSSGFQRTYFNSAADFTKSIMAVARNGFVPKNVAEN